MSKRKSFKLSFNGEVVLRIEIAGSDEIVDTLVKDTWFNHALRNGVEKLVEDKITKTVKQPQP